MLISKLEKQIYELINENRAFSHNLEDDEKIENNFKLQISYKDDKRE